MLLSLRAVWLMIANGGVFLRLTLQSPVCVYELRAHTVGDDEEHEQTDRETERQTGAEARLAFARLKPLFTYQTALFI